MEAILAAVKETAAAGKRCWPVAVRNLPRRRSNAANERLRLVITRRW